MTAMMEEKGCENVIRKDGECGEGADIGRVDGGREGGGGEKDGGRKTIYDKPITTKNVVGFVVPTVLRMIFISMYTIVDGIVVANYVGPSGLAAINIVYPAVDISMAMAFMFAMGGSAIIGKKLGEGKNEEANSFMSLLVLLNLAIMGVFLAVFYLFDEEMYRVLGSDEALLPLCKEYGNILVAGGLLWLLQILFQDFLIAADKPGFGLALSIVACVVNVGLDILLVGVFRMGLAGAALASVAGMMVGGLVPIAVLSNKKSLLHFQKPKWVGKDLLKTIGNGSSELVTSYSGAFVGALLNNQLMKYMGENGVAAASAGFYLQFVFIAVFFGFSSGVSPLYSYNYGAKNAENVRKLFKICIKLIALTSLVMFLLSQLLAEPLTLIFASKDRAMFDLTVHGFRIMSTGTLFAGITTFAPSLFTALSDGKTSAILSALRTLVFQAAALACMPLIFGKEGIWWAITVSEVCALICVWYAFSKLKKGGYLFINARKSFAQSRGID